MQIYYDDFIEQLRTNWRKYMKYLIMIGSLLLGFYIIYEIIQYKHIQSAINASIIYQEIDGADLNTLTNTQAESIYAAAKLLQQKHTHTTYATMASIMAAKVAYTHENNDLAIQLLNWVVQHTTNDSMRSISILYLCNIYIEIKQFKLALDILKQPHDETFNALYYMKRGDVFLIQKNFDQALAAYRQAMKDALNNQDLTHILQFKINLLT